MIKIMIVIGTRPEAIKMVPLALALGRDSRFDYRVVLTGQHKEMAREVLREFNVGFHYDLNLMKMDQTLNDLAGDIFKEIQKTYLDYKPEMVLVQGDTTTTLVAAVASFYMKIPVGHVEAGLRTPDKRLPFPEEMNRRLVSQIADLHFAPTERNKARLLDETIPADGIVVTGNTVIDVMKAAVDGMQDSFEYPFVVVTSHRRDNYDTGIKNICLTIRELAVLYPAVKFFFVLHPNPNIKKVVVNSFDDISNVILLDPQPYKKFLLMLIRSRMVITDSGGIQEEAYSLGVPLIILRNETERTEVLDSRYVFLTGTDRDKILAAFKEFIQIEKAETSSLSETFGKGNTSELILNKIEKYFGGL